MSDAAYAKAATDLQLAVANEIGNGDGLLANGNLAGAVAAYQTAGAQGATNIGPEIDASGHPDVTQQYTQQAWQINGSLAAVNGSSPTQQDALTAQSLAHSMLDLYTQAIQAGAAADSMPIWPWVLGIGVLAAGVGAAVIVKRRAKKRSGGGAPHLYYRTAGRSNGGYRTAALRTRMA